jgi:hypothetical protein
MPVCAIINTATCPVAIPLVAGSSYIWVFVIEWWTVVIVLEMCLVAYAKSVQIYQ